MTESKPVPSLAEVLTADVSGPFVSGADIDTFVGDAIRLAQSETDISEEHTSELQ